MAWATHPNTSGFGCCLKEVPVRLCRPRVCGFSLFLSSSPVKWDRGEETSLCELLVHSCCWGLYLSAHPSACHHTSAAISVYLVPLLSSLVHFFPVLCLAAAFYSFFFSLPLAVSLFLYLFLLSCTFSCHQAGGRSSSLVCPRAVRVGRNKPRWGATLIFTPVIRVWRIYCSKNNLLSHLSTEFQFSKVGFWLQRKFWHLVQPPWNMGLE